MISGIIDKIVFATVLLILFQLPLLADHYHQYLQGYFDATDKQVQQYTALANEHHYPNLQAMLDEHKRNTLDSVRADAELKQQHLLEHQQTQMALTIFEQENLWQQVKYMTNPSHARQLWAVLHNFAPGIPLTPRYLLMCAIIALVFNLLAATPFQAVRYFRRKRNLALDHKKTA